LPENRFIHSNLPVYKENTAEPTNKNLNAELNAESNAESNDIPNAINHVSMGPDLRPQQTELEFIQEDLTGEIPAPPQPDMLSMASFRQIPISEWNNKCILRMAFPTLFPQGLEDINLPRTYPITFA
jgi:hypothetical protein